MSFSRPEIIRPPSEWRSYFLPLTNGCSNNTCTFCRYYGSKLQIRDVDDVKSEIDALALFTRKGIRLPNISGAVYAIAQDWDGKKIFLQDGDALVYPFPKLMEVLQYLNEKLPFVERIGAYATPKDILRRSADELKHTKTAQTEHFLHGA
jgi:tRNA A37 methylthiotransferase MiaB